MSRNLEELKSKDISKLFSLRVGNIPDEIGFMKFNYIPFRFEIRILKFLIAVIGPMSYLKNLNNLEKLEIFTDLGIYQRRSHLLSLLFVMFEKMMLMMLVKVCIRDSFSISELLYTMQIFKRVTSHKTLDLLQMNYLMFLW